MWLALGPVGNGASFHSLSILFLNIVQSTYYSHSLLFTHLLFSYVSLVDTIIMHVICRCCFLCNIRPPCTFLGFVTGQLFTQVIFGLQHFVILIYSSSFYSFTFTVHTIVLLSTLRVRFHCIPINHLLSYIWVTYIFSVHINVGQNTDIPEPALLLIFFTLSCHHWG